jgi:lysophospholipase L1-like esterase
MAATCTVSPEQFLFEPTLPALNARLVAGKPVTIVAIGSASTEGRAAGAPERAWPGQLKEALQREFPAAPITVVNLGKAGQTAAAMRARFLKEVFPKKPTLVIWQTGTVDAVRNVDFNDFRDTLETGLAQLTADAEVVLMDMQFSRLTNAMIDFERYERAMVLMADVNDVPLFPRQALMRDWSEAGELDLAATGKAARQAVARKLYRCIGEALGVFLTRTPEDGARKP